MAGNSQQNPIDGVVRADSLYTWPDLCRHLRWGGRAQRQALQRGLRTIRFARQRYVAGQDVLAFFSQLASDGKG